MKTTKYLIAFFFVICLIIPFSAHATDDTAVYDISQDVKPNVLIIFDNSTSMNDGVPYVDDIEPPYPGSYVPATIYIRGSCARYFLFWCVEYNWDVYGTPGDFVDADLDGIHDDYSNLRLKKGNRLNYEDLPDTEKIVVAKQVTCDVIDDIYNEVRLGVLVLNGDLSSSNEDYHTDTSVLSTAEGGSEIKQWDDEGGDDDKDILKGYINAMSCGGSPIQWTPLANRLINAAEYFKGNFGSYDDPIDATSWCRENYVIIVTDGQPTHEGDTKSNSDNDAGDFDHIEDWFDPSDADAADYDNDGSDPNGAAYDDGGSDYLDDVAKYLYDTDLWPGIQGTQNVTTFTIGFAYAHDLLGDTADNGGGEYYTAYSASELEQKLRSVMATIIDRSQTFTAPVVPVQRTTSGDKMYISLFTPRSTQNFWPGYLVKLGIGSNGELMGFFSGYDLGAEVQVTDSNGILHEDLLKSDRPPYPYWDAHEVLKGTNEASRNIYTYISEEKALDHPSNGFTTTNTGNLTAPKLGNPSDRAALIQYIRGVDSFDDDEDTDVTEMRDNILGDILHSRPLIIDYEASNATNPQRVIYVGTNDGMLHAFNDTDGSEKWAFIPPDLLPKLKEIVDGSGHQYFVDSSPQAYIKDVGTVGNIDPAEGDQVIIIFGERRGGTSYCALDVSDPDDPQFLWRIDSVDTSGAYGIPAPDLVIAELGQSWSEPEIGKVKAGTVGSEVDTIVAIIGGGFNDETPNQKGRGLFIINVLTGELIKSYTVADSGTYSVLGNMTYSIPSTVLAVDTTFDSYINRVYVGDLGGQMWRFGFQRADASDTGLENANVNNWTPRRLFAESTLSPLPKIFYPPDMVLEPGYAYLYFGTGDRTDPMSTTEANRFYAVKDKNENDTDFQTRVGGNLVDANLVDLTENLIQDGNAAEIAAAYAALAAGDGWYLDMENTGEKTLAPATVLFGMVLFTTFTPVDTVANPCSYGGDARLYAVDYLTAVSVKDWDDDDDLDKSDRSVHIGQGIPTEVVITITDTGEVRGYVGAGGGIIHWDFTGSTPRFSIDAWREEF